MKARPLLPLLSLLALHARSAAADPSIWERARDPQAGERALATNRVERILGSIDLPELDPEFSAAAIALTSLSRMLPACSAGDDYLVSASQARFEFLIGGALLEANRAAEAGCILRRALRSAPQSPLAAEGWSNLGNANAKLGDTVAERAAYSRALELTWRPDARSALATNLAESEMMALDLKAAVRDYRAALTEARAPETSALAYFGLSVALDRSGDLPSALAAAFRALSFQPTPSVDNGALDTPGVFFTPDYEIHYYKALSAMAVAREATDDRARRDALATADEHWASYLTGAEVDAAPWLPRARLHRARVAADLAALTAKLPKAAALPDDPTAL